jgi:DNA-binding CsgD family transcriptional regulator
MTSVVMPVAGCPVFSVFESLGYGGFLLDRERQVLAHNGIAANILGGGLTLRGRRVAATDRASDRRLQSVIEAVLTGEGPSPAASVGVRRDSRLPLLVRILRLEDDGWAAANPARLLLLVCDPERGSLPPCHILAEMFSLTPAEAGVAVGIAAGRQLTEIAADRGVGIETVRSYSKTVFGKTQTRGQAELAALLTRLAVLVPHGG